MASSLPGQVRSTVEPATATGPPSVARLPGVGLGVSRRALACSLLGTMIVTSFLMAAGTAAKHYGPTLHIHHGLPNSIRGPLYGLGLSMSGTEFAILFIVLGLCYLGVLALSDSVPVRLGVGAIVALHVIFLIAPPLLSSDIFNYIGYARLEVVHNLNAYVQPLAAAPVDPSYIYVGWPLNTSAYGPLFTIASMPLGLVSFPAAVWLMKTAVAAASLGCVALVWGCATRLGRPAMPAVLFFGLNPVLLAYAVGGAHNDMLMLLAALAGIYLLIAGRETGMVGLVAAAAVKTSAVIIAPFALLGSRRPVRAILWGGAAALVVLVLTLAVFGTHVSSLLHVLKADARLDTPNDVPGVINSVFGLGLTNAQLGKVGMYFLAIAVAFLLIRTYRGGDWLENAGWATAALLVSTTWFLPWYLVWFLPLAALAVRPYQRFTAIVLTALAIGLQLPLIFGH
jgi:alpha-1,6-mannosyltransferase